MSTMSPSSLPADTLGFAFGGGGVRGWAHIGVLTVLERYGLRADLVAGCSAGAVTAAYYAAGFSAERLAEVMRSQRTRALFSLRFDRYGLVSADDFAEMLRGHLGDRRIEDLDLPLYIVTTELETGKEVILDRGPLVESILASCALPGIFAPVRIGGRLLIDGGVCNNVPVSALVNHGAAYTVGVQLYKRIGALHPLGDGTLDEPDDEVEQKVGLGLWAEQFRQRFSRAQDDRPNGLEVVQRALDIMMAQLEGFRLQTYRPDVLVVPQVGALGLFSFSQEKEIIFQAGVEAAEQKASELERLAQRVQQGR